MSLAADVSRFLKAEKIALDKNFGQHFLVDESVLRDMLKAAKIQPGERVVEVGPGLGVLTRELLKAGANVTAIELDRRWMMLATAFVAEAGRELLDRLTLTHGDALQIDLPNEPYAVVANIPYQITGKLIRRFLLESPVTPRSLTLLVQREVAQKICDAEKGGMSRLLVELFGTAKMIRKVPPGAFVPPPAVDSAILHIECFPTPKAERAIVEKALELASIAFQQKRKMVRGTLGAFRGGMERLERAAIAENLRPEKVSVDQWVSLARAWTEDDA